jgi:hypothetical protein
MPETSDDRPQRGIVVRDRIFVLSRLSGTVGTSRQIFRFCAWLLSSLFGAPASWVDSTPNHMAAALTIRPLLTRLADVLEGRAGDCRGDAHLMASAPPVAGATPKPGRSGSCPGGMDTSRCSGSVTIACRAVHFTGDVPSPLTASPAKTSSRERRSWRGRGARGRCPRLGLVRGQHAGSAMGSRGQPRARRFYQRQGSGQPGGAGPFLTARGGTSVRCPWTWAYPAPRIHFSRKFVEPVAPRIRAPGVPLAHRCP